MLHKTLFYIAISGLLFASCKPNRDDDFPLPPTPAAPEFSITPLPGDSNTWVIKDLSTGNFQRLWDLPGGTPKSSVKAIDTVVYGKAGNYTITLFVSKADGSGTPSASKKISLTKDANLACTPALAALTGNCSPAGKCWTLSHAAGAVKVGPTYDDYSWYTSPVNGLQAEQYDDGFCFTFQDLVFQNKNNGTSIDPWNGYVPKVYNPGVSSFAYLTGTGTNGRDQIQIPDNQFMGVWDSDNLLDVVQLTATDLIVRTRQRDPNGVPLAQGWFELHFVPK
jgi:PKD repeat protein